MPNQSWPSRHPWMTFFLALTGLSTVAAIVRPGSTRTGGAFGPPKRLSGGPATSTGGPHGHHGGHGHGGHGGGRGGRGGGGLWGWGGGYPVYDEYLVDEPTVLVVEVEKEKKKEEEKNSTATKGLEALVSGSGVDQGAAG